MRKSSNLIRRIRALEAEAGCVPSRTIPTVCPTCNGPRHIISPAWLAHVRITAKLTQAELAKKCGIGALYLKDMEQGRRLIIPRVAAVVDSLAAGHGCEPRHQTPAR